MEKSRGKSNGKLNYLFRVLAVIFVIASVSNQSMDVKRLQISENFQERGK